MPKVKVAIALPKIGSSSSQVKNKINIYIFVICYLWIKLDLQLFFGSYVCLTNLDRKDLSLHDFVSPPNY